jgi:arabinose-5-phosphate isomerase
MLTNEKFCELGRTVIETEAKAVAELAHRIDENFAEACRLLLACEGRIVVIGMGKSGHIGNKIAATLASTGTPAFFVHPAEASHGDFGMITHRDAVLALSNSGETQELLTLLPLIKLLGVPMIAFTGNPNSTLAKEASIHLNISVTQEACPLGLAPTSSTTATLAMGDALAIALLEARGFTADDFAKVHPKGNLGLRLLLRVAEVMHTGDNMPCVQINAPVSQALIEMSQKRLGMTAVVDQNHRLAGIFTDGDLRRAIDRDIDIHKTQINDVMTKNCKTISANLLASEALNIMETFKITALVVVDTETKPVGIVHIHDILIAGMK